MVPRSIIASCSREVPTRRAVAPATGPAKNTQTCAPRPDFDSSTAAGTPSSPSRLHVGQRVEHGRRTVEVGNEETAGIVLRQWIQTDEHVLLRQVRSNHLTGERKVPHRAAVHSLAPPARHGRHPPVRPRPEVLPVERIDVGPRAEQVGIQRELVLHRRRHRYHRRRRGRSQLLRRWRRVLTPEVEQPRQSGVLGAQSIELATQLRVLAVGRNAHRRIVARLLSAQSSRSRFQRARVSEGRRRSFTADCPRIGRPLAGGIHRLAAPPQPPSRATDTLAPASRAFE